MNANIDMASARARALRLTEDEALALLEICMLAETDDNPIRDSAMAKLGGLCREFLKEESVAKERPVIRVHGGFRRSLARAMLSREPKPATGHAV